MPAVNSVSARSVGALSQLQKRNFASKEPGVILVFAIIGAVVILLGGLFLQRKLAARRAAKASL
jgi:hypothetical protein